MAIFRMCLISTSLFYSLFVFANDSINIDKGSVGRITFVGAILEAPCQFSISENDISLRVGKYSSVGVLPMRATSCDVSVLSGASYSISIPQGNNIIYESGRELIPNAGNKKNINTKVDEADEAQNINLPLYMNHPEWLAKNSTVGVTIDYW